MTLHPVAHPHISAIPPYPPGRPISAIAREFGFSPEAIVKLASNENPLGSSPKVVKALTAAAAEVNRYPDFDCFELYDALSRHLAIPARQLALGAGSSELLQVVVRAYVAPDDKVVMPQYSFISYESCARSVGARAVVVPNRGWAPDLDGILAAIDERVRVVFLATPNNPTGISVSSAELERFVDAMPQNVVLVLDEAYRDYLKPSERPLPERLLAGRRNLLILRTFSKVYGLAGLRIGYGIGDPELIGVLRRLLPPFSVNTLGQVAAVAALADDAFVARSVALNTQERDRLMAAFESGSFEYVPSSANFVLVHVGEGARTFEAMLKRGVIVRPVANYSLPEWLRVSVGLSEENDKFLSILRELYPAGSRAAKPLRDR